MRIGIVHNVAAQVVAGPPDDLASDTEMAIIPELVGHELRRLGHEPFEIAADWSLAASCRSARLEIVLNLAEGFAGMNAHEHLVPCILDFHGIHYTGADAANMQIVRDKLFTKHILQDYGVRSPLHQLFESATEPLDRSLRFPLILKPVREEASIGIRFNSVVSSLSELLERAGQLIETYRQPVLAEEFIVGREFSVGILGNSSIDVLPPVEFRFADRDPLRQFRSFEYKWLGEQEAMVQPTDIDAVAVDTMNRYTVTAHRVLRCRDYSRSDFRLAEDGTVYLLEHNFNPGIGPNTHGLSNTLTRMAEFAGIDWPAMLERILSLALKRYDLPGR